MAITCGDNPPRIDSTYRVVIPDLIRPFDFKEDAVSVTRDGVPLAGERRIKVSADARNPSISICTLTFKPDQEKTHLAPGDTLDVRLNGRCCIIGHRSVCELLGAGSSLTRSFTIQHAPVMLRVTLTGHDQPDVRGRLTRHMVSEARISLIATHESALSL